MEFERRKTDVLIIGGGVTGFMAAYWMSKDKTVTLLHTGRGASPYITGYNAVVSEGDSVETFINDTYASGWKQGNPELIRAMCEGSTTTIPFLKEIGFQFDMEGDNYRARRPIGASYPRVVGNGNISGKIIVDLLIEELKERETFTLMTPVRILRLLKKNNRACGALGVDVKENKLICFDTSAVILAVGGFCKIYEFSSNTSDIGGDGVAMAYELGLPLVDLEFVQFEPSGAVWPLAIRGHGMITTLNHEGAVIKNNEGERFMFRYDPNGEKVNKDLLGRGIYTEVKEGRGSPHGGVWFDCTAVPEKRIHEAYEMFYQRYIRQGIDLTKEPIEIFPAAHTSLGGVVINKDCSTALSGLFVGGETAGGIYGSNRIGGSAGTETQVFGKIAGIAANAYLESNEAPAFATDEEWQILIDETAGQGNGPVLTEEEMNAMRSDMENTLSADLNVVRVGADIERASAHLKEMLEKVEASGKQTTVEGLLKKTRIQHDLQTAYLLSLSALERTESNGCHWRTDSGPAPEKPYRIFVQKDESGSPKLTRAELPWLT